MLMNIEKKNCQSNTTTGSDDVGSASGFRDINQIVMP